MNRHPVFRGGTSCARREGAGGGAGSAGGDWALSAGRVLAPGCQVPKEIVNVSLQWGAQGREREGEYSINSHWRRTRGRALTDETASSPAGGDGGGNADGCSGHRWRQHPGPAGSRATLGSLVLLLSGRAARTLSAVRKQLAGPRGGVGSPWEESCGKNQITYCCVAVSSPVLVLFSKHGGQRGRRASVGGAPCRTPWEAAWCETRAHPLPRQAW